ncbi:MAG: complex I subunit 5 family protein [Candidatus Binatia bacterium]
MNLDAWLPLLVVATSLLTGLCIFFLGEEQQKLRTVLNITGAIVKLLLIGVMLWGVFYNHNYETHLPLLPGIELVFRADALAMFFTTLSAGLWLFTTLYAIGYLEDAPHRSRFFGFFSLCVTSTMGVALANNLFTFFLFYELLTLVTYPLVVHRGTPAALHAGRTYLCYTLGGGTVLLIGVVWLHLLAGPVAFSEGGTLGPFQSEHRHALIAIFTLFIIGFGVKAALVPLHGWLPVAMAAPAPVSALLHAVAVVKAGAFGIIRVVYDVFGITLVQELGVTAPLAFLAAFTIVYGSIRALAQDDLKRRLAYSTVSQVSYIALGVAIVGSLSTVGGVVHLVHQGIMKITLFFCAGVLAETLGIHRISEMRGVGRRMPWTMTAFAIAAFGMIGVPPTAGFISKWYLGIGSVTAGQSWVLVVLVISSLLNAAYFLPILYAAWFCEPEGEWHVDHPGGRFEADWRLLLPPLVTAALVLAAGLLANTDVSPLAWAQLIAQREYQQ